MTQPDQTTDEESPVVVTVAGDAADVQNATMNSMSLSHSDKETVVRLMEQEQVDRQQKLTEQELSVQHRETVAAIAQDDKLEAKAARASSEMASFPGAWGAYQQSQSQQSQSQIQSTPQPDDNGVTALENHADEETGVVDQEDMNSEDILIQAELVEEKMEESPPMKDPELLVDAEMLDSSPEMVKRRRMIRTLSIVTCIVITVAIIVLSVVLTRGDEGGSTTELQIVTSSTAPTMSIAPSTNPSSSPSKAPSDVPSQAPTRLQWEANQSLEGLQPLISIEGATPLGGQQFGKNMHVSDISGTPLANRTGRDILAAIQFAENSSIFRGGALQAFFLGVAIYLCKGDKFTREDTDFCELVYIVEFPTQTMTLSNTALLTISKGSPAFSIYDLGDVDQKTRFGLSSTRSGSLSFGIPDAVSVNSDGTRFVFVTEFRKELRNFGEPIVVAPPTLPPLVPGGPVLIPLPTEPISLPIELSDGAGVYQTLPAPSDSSFPGEIFWSVLMTDDTIVTINAVENPQSPTECFADLVCLYYGSYKLYHTNLAFENTLPPLHVDDASSSPFSRKGFSINQDATIVAISSALVDYNETSLVSANEVEFEVRVFQLVNSSEWEMMGPPISSPAPASGDYFGHSLAFNAEGTVLVVGANKDRENGLRSGKVYSYAWNGSAWQALGDPLAGTAGSSFGEAIALSDDASTLMIGAPDQDINGVDSGETSVYQLFGV